MSEPVVRWRLRPGAAAAVRAAHSEALAATAAAADRMLATVARLHVLGCELGPRCPAAGRR